MTLIPSPSSWSQRTWLSQRQPSSAHLIHRSQIHTGKKEVGYGTLFDALFSKDTIAFVLLCALLCFTCSADAAGSDWLIFLPANQNQNGTGGAGGSSGRLARGPLQVAGVYFLRSLAASPLLPTVTHARHIHTTGS